jgi:hypothetical protein
MNPNPTISAKIAAKDEARIRRAVRVLIRSVRHDDGADDVQYAFDLLHYLRPEARVILEDEIVLMLEDLISRD